MATLAERKKVIAALYQERFGREVPAIDSPMRYSYNSWLSNGEMENDALDAALDKIVSLEQTRKALG